MTILLPRRRFISARLILAIIVFFSIAINAPIELAAKVIYVEMDTTITAPYHTQKMITFDMNKDGMEDFAIGHNNPGGMECYVDIFTHNGGIYLDAQNKTIALNAGFDICKSLGKWKTTSGLGMHFTPEWYGGGDLYVGIRFKIGDAFRYGWILMSIPSDTSSFTVKGYAYEEDEGVGIKAGAKSSSGSTDNGNSMNAQVRTSGKTITVFSDCNSALTLDIYDMTGALIESYDGVRSGESVYCALTSGIYALRVRANETLLCSQIICLE